MWSFTTNLPHSWEAPSGEKMAPKVEKDFSQKALTQGCWITQKLKIDQGPPMGHILAEISHLLLHARKVWVVTLLGVRQKSLQPAHGRHNQEILACKWT